MIKHVPFSTSHRAGPPPAGATISASAQFGSFLRWGRPGRARAAGGRADGPAALPAAKERETPSPPASMLTAWPGLHAAAEWDSIAEHRAIADLTLKQITTSFIGRKSLARLACMRRRLAGRGAEAGRAPGCATLRSLIAAQPGPLRLNRTRCASTSERATPRPPIGGPAAAASSTRVARRARARCPSRAPQPPLAGSGGGWQYTVPHPQPSGARASAPRARARVRVASDVRPGRDRESRASRRAARPAARAAPCDGARTSDGRAAVRRRRPPSAGLEPGTSGLCSLAGRISTTAAPAPGGPVGSRA
jgi:hypothetical protein